MRGAARSGAPEVRRSESRQEPGRRHAKRPGVRRQPRGRARRHVGSAEKSKVGNRGTRPMAAASTSRLSDSASTARPRGGKAERESARRLHRIRQRPRESETTSLIQPDDVPDGQRARAQKSGAGARGRVQRGTYPEVRPDEQRQRTDAGTTRGKNSDDRDRFGRSEGDGESGAGTRGSTGPARESLRRRREGRGRRRRGHSRSRLHARSATSLTKELERQ